MSPDPAAATASDAAAVEPKPGVPGQVRRIPPESPLADILDGDARREIRVHDHGFIALVDVMPRLVPAGQTADAAIVQAARVSYGAGTKKVSEDAALIRYLLRHRHTTPFEMVELKFHMAMPMFVARQWIRHRTANVNEYSARYSVVPDRFYRPAPDQVRKQSTSNRQGGEDAFDRADPAQAATADGYLAYLDAVEAQYKTYESLLEQGVSRELARAGLPVSAYTEWYWKCDLHNTLRFLSLRLDAHAQQEIRVYAQAMHDLMLEICPVTMQAWRDYEFEAMHLTRLEIEAIRRVAADPTADNLPLDTPNKREQAEWDAKRARLGL
ncbi:MAG: FAD-dependent thymidylate synthase [Phycisphaerales bacterium]|nr:MAG: FAD-dependent thymidylate synthase [Phycisphaerales bacterium]